jgi:hypothetical protein
MRFCLLEPRTQTDFAVPSIVTATDPYASKTTNLQAVRSLLFRGAESVWKLPQEEESLEGEVLDKDALPYL